MDDSAWDRLISKIKESNVVPILGPRLLVGADGESSMQALVARRLMEVCAQPADTPLPPFREMNEAVSLLRGSVDPQDLYDHVHDALQWVVRSSGFTIPAPIRQMAQIAGFKLFVTLTPDGLLAKCLGMRSAVNEIVHSPNLPTSEGKDLPDDWKSRAGEVQLLYLFGKSRSAPMFAIHDEDVLEYAHNVISQGSHVPKSFLAELQQRNLLLLGCNFPDWLTRFFLRATNQRRLSEKSRREWLIEPLKPEENLTVFLRGYSKETEILSQDSPVEFVAQLHKRWIAANGDSDTTDSDAEKPQPPKAMFFISYSRKSDFAKAESLYQALLQQGVSTGEVWFDRTTIDPGQDYQRKIADGIRGCRYFVPLVSMAVNGREEGFVFTEWEKACERLPQMNREFVLPIIVDDDYDPEIYQPKQVWEWRQRNIDFGHAPGGRPDGRLTGTLRRLVREARSRGEAS